VAAVARTVTVPTRRWTREEVVADREEGEYRSRTGDTTGWLNGVARVCVNYPERLPERYGGSVEKAVAAVARWAVEWTDRVVADYATRPEVLDVEVQALRIGDMYLAANPSEFFTTQALSLRERWGTPDLLVLGYSNGSVGYLPDAHDVARRTYAAYTSPKAAGHFPFTEASGPAVVEGLLQALAQTGER
jgi:hypothetical protein